MKELSPTWKWLSNGFNPRRNYIATELFYDSSGDHTTCAYLTYLK